MNVSDERLDRELASSNVNRATALVGSSMAVFTFLLFFLYPRYLANAIDPILFQMTVTFIVVTIFCFGFSGFYYYGIISVPKMRMDQLRSYRRRADGLFILGLVFAVIEPALILFTINIVTVGIIAIILWLIFVSALFVQSRRQ